MTRCIRWPWSFLWMTGLLLCAALGVAVQAQTSGAGRVWTRFRGSNADDKGQAAAVDSQSNVYVCGYTAGVLDGETNKGQALIKWNAAGEWIWTRTLGGSGAEAHGVAVDTQDNVYVCGTAIQNFDGQAFRGTEDPFIRKWDQNGNWQWTRLWGTNEEEEARGLAVFGTNIYVGGYTLVPFDGQPTIGRCDVFVSLWHADGTKLWTQILGTPSNDYPMIMQGHAGDAFTIAGDTEGAWAGQTNQGCQDVFVMVFDKEGTLRWVRTFGGTNSEYASGVTLGVSAVYVAGYVLPGSSWGGQTTTGPHEDTFLEARAGNGATNWTRFWGSTNADIPGKIAAAADGAVYIPGMASAPGYDGQNASGGQDITISRYEPGYRVRITNVNLTAGASVLQWRGAYDWQYSLMECADLADGSWNTVAGQSNLPGQEFMCATGWGPAVHFWRPRASH